MLDNMTTNLWFCGNQNVVARVEEIQRDSPHSLIVISVVTFGEVVYGHARNTSTDLARRAEFEQWLADKFPRPLRITKAHARIYGELKAVLFRLYPPQNKTRFVDRCFDKVSGSELGIDDNDLWIAAQAFEQNFVLVSDDKMNRIRTAAGAGLKCENWRNPPTNGRYDCRAARP